MRMLIITQKIDEQDAVLGFMHGWLAEFAKNFENVVAVCLEKGRVNLPEDVRVFSLGKEENNFLRGGGSVFPSTGSGSRAESRDNFQSILNLKILKKIKYFLRFIRYIVQFRDQYDAVFVHMNPEYVILGGVLWRLWGKKIVLWYNHGSGGLRLRLAMMLAHTVCHTSPYAASAGSKKSRMMPVGVDTKVFKAVGGVGRHLPPRQLLSLGRIAPIKHADIILDAVIYLLNNGEDVKLSLAGDALPRDAEYFNRLKKRARDSVFADRIDFCGAIGEREKVAALFGTSEFFLNASPAGLFDKTVFEAMASGCIPVVSSKAFAGILPAECLFDEGDGRNLALRLSNFFRQSPEQLERLGHLLRQKVAEEHSIKILVERLKNLFESES